MNYILICIATSVIFLTTACFYEKYAYREYDPENEYDYLHFWCDPKNIEKNKAIANPTGHNLREWKPRDETISQTECLENSGVTGN